MLRRNLVVELSPMYCFVVQTESLDAELPYKEILATADLTESTAATSTAVGPGSSQAVRSVPYRAMMRRYRRHEGTKGLLLEQRL